MLVDEILRDSRWVYFGKNVNLLCYYEMLTGQSPSPYEFHVYITSTNIIRSAIIKIFYNLLNETCCCTVVTEKRTRSTEQVSSLLQSRGFDDLYDMI